MPLFGLLLPKSAVSDVAVAATPPGSINATVWSATAVSDVAVAVGK
jgi:hypothetical protein